MDDHILRSRLQSPVTTGTPGLTRPKPAQQSPSQDEGSFQKLLEQRLADRQSIQFSKHAVNRLETRNIQLSPGNMDRLQQGIDLAQEKGLDDALILMDQAGFIVSAKNRTIITALGSSDLKGTVITNITGTVII